MLSDRDEMKYVITTVKHMTDQFITIWMDDVVDLMGTRRWMMGDPDRQMIIERVNCAILDTHKLARYAPTEMD